MHEALPAKLRETAYAVALEVAAADRQIKPEEIRFLEMLGDTLELDKMTTAAIERGIRARNTTLWRHVASLRTETPRNRFCYASRWRGQMLLEERGL